MEYEKMILDIDELMQSDFLFDMDCKSMPNSSPFNQKEAKEMCKLLMKIYHISHQIHCEACQETKYKI